MQHVTQRIREKSVSSILFNARGRPALVGNNKTTYPTLQLCQYSSAREALVCLFQNTLEGTLHTQNTFEMTVLRTFKGRGGVFASGVKYQADDMSGKSWPIWTGVYVYSFPHGDNF